MKVTITALILLLFSIQSYAGGNEFLSDCKAYITLIDGQSSNGSAFGAGTCAGIIQGMRHMNSLYEYSGSNPLYCIPKNVQASQLVRVVVKYLEENPDKLHEHEAYLIGDAFASSFNCK